MRQIKIGRNQDNDLVFPSSVVSGYHADITIQDNGLVVYTDHSTNGTVINGLKLHGNSVMVKPSDSIVLPDGSNIDLASLINHGGTVHVSHSGTVPVSPQFSAPYFQEQKQFAHDSSPADTSYHPVREACLHLLYSILWFALAGLIAWLLFIFFTDTKGGRIRVIAIIAPFYCAWYGLKEFALFFKTLFA